MRNICPLAVALVAISALSVSLSACQRPSEPQKVATTSKRECLPPQPTPSRAPSTAGMVLVKSGEYLQGAEIGRAHV